MQDNNITDDFVFIKQHLYSIFQWMHETPVFNHNNTPLTDRIIADIRWMSEHHYYPSPGQLDRIIFVLRETKFRLVREKTDNPELLEDIQQKLNTLKDIRKFLQLNTHYKQDGDIISLNPFSEWKTITIILLIVAVTLLTFSSLCYRFANTPYYIYTAGMIFYALTTLILTLREENIPRLFSFGGVAIFTLLLLL